MAKKANKIFYGYKKGEVWDKYLLSQKLMFANIQKIIPFKQEVKVTANRQKQIFGYNVFGRKSIEVNPEKQKIFIIFSVSYGQMRDAYIFTFSKFAELLNNKEKI